MTNHATTLTTGTSIPLGHACQIISEHGHEWSVQDLGSDGVALFVHIPWTNAMTGTEGVDIEHVQDTDNGRILVSHLRTALGY